MQKWHDVFSANSEQETFHTNITPRPECFGMLRRVSTSIVINVINPYAANVENRVSS